MPIFDTPDIPAWMNPARNILETGREATPGIGTQFGAGFRQGMEQRFKSDLIKYAEQKQSLEELNKAIKTNKVAQELAGASTPEETWDVVSKNPQWLADANTAPFVQSYLKTQTDVARAEVNSIQGKTKIADITNFTKRISNIDPADRAAIQSMSANPDGSISANQWNALGLAEERSVVAKENQRKIAEIEALNRGDVPTTVITDKSISTTYKPAAKESSPKTLDIGNGNVIAWVPGGNTLHVIKSNGQKQEFTPAQLSAIAKGMDDEDPRKKEIMDFLGNRAVNQITPKTNSTSSGTSEDPLGLFK